jgi:hypothetical protein
MVARCGLHKKCADTRYAKLVFFASGGICDSRSAFRCDEDINPDKGTATPTKPEQAPPGPLTRARARELNFVMILKNEGPEAS